MRTNIDIDETLLREAMELTAVTTKKAAVEEALRKVVQLGRQRRTFDALYGVGWEGDLDELREGWSGIQPTA